MKTFLLFSALMAAVACDENPWQTCPPSSKLKCYIHGTGEGDNLGPPMSDVTILRDYWVKQSIDIAKSDGGVDADPSTQDPDTWGPRGGLALKASVYDDGCIAYNSDPNHNKDAVVKVCQPHATGNLLSPHFVKDVCVSIYIDEIIDGCLGEADDDSRLNGQVWIEHWGATLRVTNK